MASIEVRKCQVQGAGGGGNNSGGRDWAELTVSIGVSKLIDYSQEMVFSGREC